MAVCACVPSTTTALLQQPRRDQTRRPYGNAVPCWDAAAQRRRRRRPSAIAAADDAAASTAAAAAPSHRYLSPDGRWLVRPMDKACAAEVRRVVALQAEAFHTPAPLPLLDGFARDFFKAEVLSEMQKKLRYNPTDLFLSLVLEEASAAAAEVRGSSSSSSSSSSKRPAVVGAVELSYISEPQILQHLEPGTEAFCYIASMMVAPDLQRRGGAVALLAAAERAAAAWDETQALLQVYQDNAGAVQLYRRQGYEVVHAQKPALWVSRPRFLMRKRW